MSSDDFQADCEIPVGQAGLINETATAAPIRAKAPEIAALASASAALSACGGGGSSGGGSAAAPAPPVAAPPPVRRPQTDAEAARFLLQTALAASPAEIGQLRTEGFEPWLDREMRQSNDSTARQYFETRGYDEVNANRFYDNSNLGDWMMWSQLLSGGSAVRKRIALALSEFFVVSLNEVSITWRSQAMGEYWDILNRNAFGSFRQLLEDITLNPAMGVFLNTRGNRRADTRTGRVPDENYAREVMQLFSIGLVELNPDGTPRRNGDSTIETYTSEDVSGIARVFTGYDFDFSQTTRIPEPGNASRTVPSVDYVRRSMTADPTKWSSPGTTSFHAPEEKRFLGIAIPPNTGAAESLQLALDRLAAHPNTGPFFARQMIQRLVTSNPTPAYVGRVAAVFANNGSGQRGDLRAVFKAILLDEEALGSANLTNPGFGKLREPMLRFVQLARTFGVRSTSGNWLIGNLADPATRLGQSPLRAPSVFNFFRPGYFPPNTQIARNNLLAPEFQLVNETSVAGYVNFLETAVAPSGFLSDLTLSYAAELPIAHEAGRLLDHLDLVLTANQLSPQVKALIRPALDDIPVQATSPDADKLRRIRAAVVLVMASTDYLVQK